MASFLVVAGQVVLAAVLLFFGLFAASSFIEGQGRAFRRSLFVLAFIGVLNLSLYLVADGIGRVGFGLALVLAAATLLFFYLSPKPRKALEVAARPRRVDERDVVFARFDLRPGSAEFIEYYRMRPEHHDRDAVTRKLPDILTAPHLKKNPLLLPLAAAEFDFLEGLLTRVSGEEDAPALPVDLSPRRNSELIKDIARYLGADDCGVARLNPDFTYSHIGRGPGPYGLEIGLDHRFAIVFALEMGTAMVASAPDAPVVVETGRRYVEAARIGIILAGFLRRLGHPARAHIAGSNYQVILPPVAWEAGLGEMGRLGTLVTTGYGPRARLGLVTTDFPMEPDRPAVLGVQDFCSRCLKCARNCPAGAIPLGPPELDNGVRRWVIDREACYEFWRRRGTDCAVCLAVCPYSHPPSLFHRLVRQAASASRPGQAALIRADDFFYGKKPKRLRRGWAARWTVRIS